MLALYLLIGSVVGLVFTNISFRQKEYHCAERGIPYYISTRMFVEVYAVNILLWPVSLYVFFATILEHMKEESLR